MSEVLENAKEEIIETVFFSTKGNIKYIFKNGKEAPFVGLPEGKFATTVQAEIDELLAEIRAGHPFIHQKEGHTTQVAGETPYEAMKKKMREDILAEIAAANASAMDSKANVSTSIQDRLKAATTANTGAANAASNSGAGVFAPATPS